MDGLLTGWKLVGRHRDLNPGRPPWESGVLAVTLRGPPWPHWYFWLQIFLKTRLPDSYFPFVIFKKIQVWKVCPHLLLFSASGYLKIWIWKNMLSNTSLSRFWISKNSNLKKYASHFSLFCFWISKNSNLKIYASHTSLSRFWIFKNSTFKNIYLPHFSFPFLFT